MCPAIPQPVFDEPSDLSIARIDGQDDTLVFPLREYLETNGCRVLVNELTDKPVAYHIVVGDTDFVKDFFAGRTEAGAKQLGIIVGSAAGPAAIHIHLSKKIVLVDPTQMTQEDVIEIFSFFFAGNDQILDKRRNRHDSYEADADRTQSNEEKRLAQKTTEAPTKNFLQQKAISETPKISTTIDEDRHRIGSIISDVFANDHQTHTSKKRKKEKHFSGISFGVFFVSIFIIIIAPLLWYAVSLGATAVAMSVAARAIEKGDISSASNLQRVESYWQSQAKFVLGIMAVPARFVGGERVVRGQERILSMITDIQNAQEESLGIVSQGRELATTLLTSTGASPAGTAPAADIDRFRMSLFSVQGHLGLAQAELYALLRDRTFPFSLGVGVRLGTRAYETLKEIRGMITAVDQLLSIYPRMAGFAGPKTYLVLLQNSAELRPTGGFIGSIAVVTFADGLMSSFNVQDVYEVDGQLKGHVDPPGPIRELLSQEHWYLRDSNWDPNFAASAQRALWFYEKETDTHVDGVIAVATPFVIHLLKELGPVDLIDYNDVITAENFYGKSLFYTQHDFFPGSTQKKDFLGTLARALLTRLTTQSKGSEIGIFRAVSSAFETHDITLWFADNELETLASHYGWAGEWPSVDGCVGAPGNECLFDPLMVVEANLGVNKVNYFVSRTLAREITIAPDGGVTETVTTSIKNTSRASDAAGGSGGGYRTYIRWMVPADTTLIGATVDGISVAPRSLKQATLPPLPYMEIAPSDANSSALGMAVDVEPGTERQIVVSYKRGKVLQFGAFGATLDVLTQKQAGVSDTPVTLSLRYPLYWNRRILNRAGQVLLDDGAAPALVRSELPPGFVAKDGFVQYNTSLTRDMVLRVQFTK